MTATILMVNLPAGVEKFLREQWGHRCRFISTANPLDLHRQLMSENVTAIVTNLELPPLSAIDLTRSLRESHDTRELAVAVFSRKPDQATTSECERAGSSLVVGPKTPKAHVSAWLNRVVSEHQDATEPPSLDQNLAAAMASAVSSVADDVLGMTITREPLRIGASADHSAEIVASVTMSGFLTGTITLFFDMEFATTVATRMLGIEPGDRAGDRDVVDAAGELTNMVAGKIKTNLCMKEDLFFMSTPSVIVGKEVRRMSLDQNLAFEQPCTWCEHQFLVEVSFVPNKSSKPAVALGR